MNYPPSLEIDSSELPEDRAKLAEEVAYRVLPILMDGDIECVDVPGGPPGLHDFELASNQRRIAVEVTACIDAQAASFVDALDTRASHEDVSDLSRSWEVRLHEGTRLAGLIKDIGPLLAALEKSGVTGLARAGEYDQEPLILLAKDRITSRVRDVESALFQLGVDTAWSYPVESGPQLVVFIRRSGGGSARTEDRVTAVVNQAATSKKDVLSRTAATELDDRHLFVWVDPDLCDDVEFSLWAGHPGAAPRPDLPEPIGHAWVSTWSLTPGEGVGHVVVWEASRGGPWHYPTALAER